MRIAQVCPYSLSVPGGVQGQVIGLGHALRDMGHETRVLAPCDGPPPDPMVTPLGRSVPTAVNGSIAPVAPDPACALRTIHTLRNERFDVVHIHEPAVPGPSLTALMTAEAALIGTFHAAGTSTAYSYYTFAAKRLVKRLDVRVAVSLEAAATAQGAIGGEYEVLYNAIDVNNFTQSSSALDSLEDDAPVEILFIGRHEQRKGLSVLIDALEMLPGHFHLRIAGIGPQTQHLQQLTQGNGRITWLGKITDVQRREELQRASVFCAPSLEGESFGIVLLEAMAAGLPVVASDLSGYRYVAEGGKSAKLVAPNDSHALSVAIAELASDRTVARKLIDNGLLRANAFSMDSLAESYVELYERALSGRTSKSWFSGLFS